MVNTTFRMKYSDPPKALLQGDPYSPRKQPTPLPNGALWESLGCPIGQE